MIGRDITSKLEVLCGWARGIFKLEGLPLTLTVAQLDSTRLELRIVGLDCQDELKRLEAALQNLG